MQEFFTQATVAVHGDLQVELIGMEARGGVHFPGRALREQGREVRLMPAQYVKPHVKTNKNDYIDAEAIAEAVGRPKMPLYRSRPMTNWICSLCIEYGALGDAWHSSHQLDSWLAAGKVLSSLPKCP